MKKLLTATLAIFLLIGLIAPTALAHDGCRPDTGGLHTVTIVYCDGYVNLRAQPEKRDCNVICRIPKGTEVQAKRYNSGWYIVKFHGHTGYVMDTYIKDPQAPKKVTKPKVDLPCYGAQTATCSPCDTDFWDGSMYVKVAGLSVRASKSTNAKALEVAKFGDYVRARKVSATWTYIETPSGARGYVLGKYLSNLPVVANWDQYFVCGSKNVKLRATALPKGDVKVILAPGTVVEAAPYDEDFMAVWVENGGYYGYVAYESLKLVDIDLDDGCGINPEP